MKINLKEEMIERGLIREEGCCLVSSCYNGEEITQELNEIQSLINGQI